MSKDLASILKNKSVRALAKFGVGSYFFLDALDSGREFYNQVKNNETNIRELIGSAGYWSLEVGGVSLKTAFTLGLGYLAIKGFDKIME